jgi:glycosyltransferase involved in cell wall biosynthesis
VTDVGECAAVLEHGRIGLVVPPSSPDRLATALLSLLRTPERRAELGKAFRRRAESAYGPDGIMEQVCRVYEIART